MTIEPVKKYKTPAYPTIEQYVYNPQEFLQHTPHSWLGNAAVMTALLAFTVGGTNCVYGQIIKSNTEQIDKKPNESDQTQQEEQQKISFVAPVFIHGDGISSFGCVMVTPPVIISEQDAMEIIKNEFAKHNIKLETKTDKSIDVQVKEYDFKKEEVVTKIKKMQFDGFSPDLNFVVEFVSDNDVEYADDEKDYWISVWSNNLKSLAEKLQKQIKEDGKLNAVVFYDPVTYVKDGKNLSWKEIEVKGKAESKKLLIQQVTDFIKWLKKEKLLTDN
jgi:hypothetical protein